MESQQIISNQTVEQQLKALGDLIEVVQRLRGPGGCPWDAKQTHASLVRYCLEEAYEVAEAIETGNRVDLREELGDLLLQIVFHASIAAEDAADPFHIGDVAAQVSQKMRDRHPHVFAQTSGSDPTAGNEQSEGAGADLDLVTSWEQRKKQEKGRESVLDGIPAALPVLARADKVLSKAARTQIDITDPVAASLRHEAAEADADQIGTQLLAWIAHARSSGVDPEQALRKVLRKLEEDIRTAEAANNVV